MTKTISPAESDKRPPWQPLDAGCPTTDACLQNLKTLAAMLFAQMHYPITA